MLWEDELEFKIICFHSLSSRISREFWKFYPCINEHKILLYPNHNVSIFLWFYSFINHTSGCDPSIWRFYIRRYMEDLKNSPKPSYPDFFCKNKIAYYHLRTYKNPHCKGEPYSKILRYRQKSLPLLYIIGYIEEKYSINLIPISNFCRGFFVFNVDFFSFLIGLELNEKISWSKVKDSVIISHYVKWIEYTICLSSTGVE